MQLFNFFNPLIAAASSAGVNITFTVIFALLSVAVLFVAVFFLTKFIGKTAKANTTVVSINEVKPINFKGLLVVALIIGLIFRLIFTFLVRGYRGEFNLITSLMENVAKNGFVNTFFSNGAGKIMPLTYYIYAFFGGVSSVFGLDATSAIMPLFVKLPLILCDLATAVIIFITAKKYINQYVALILACFVCIFPLFIFSSAVWGSLYSIMAFMLTLTLYFMLERNYIALIGVYGLTLLCNKEAIYLFPLIAVFIIYNFAKAAKQIKVKNINGFKAVNEDKDTRMVIWMPIAIVITAIVMYLITLPTMYKALGGNFFVYLFQFFLKPIGVLKYFGHNSLSIFNLFMRNGKLLGTQFPSVVFAVIFGVVILGIVLLIYLSKKNRANLVYLGAYIVFTLSVYFVDFSELSILPAISALLLAFVAVKDKRMLHILGVVSLTMIVNAGVVMSLGGFFNNAEDYYINNSDVIISGVAAIAGSIICSVVAILAHFYATLVLLDISMSNKRKLLNDMPNANFLSSIKSWIK